MKIKKIEASASGECVFNLSNDTLGDIKIESNKIIVQRALITAYMTDSTVEYDLISDQLVFQRILPFQSGTYFPEVYGNYTVHRIATQRSQEGIDHLEVFILKKNDPKVMPFNIFEPLLQNMLQAAFILSHVGQIVHADRYNLELGFNPTNDSIIRVELGK